LLVPEGHAQHSQTLVTACIRQLPVWWLPARYKADLFEGERLIQFQRCPQMSDMYWIKCPAQDANHE
jgi:hypothetical protein